MILWSIGKRVKAYSSGSNRYDVENKFSLKKHKMISTLILIVIVMFAMNSIAATICNTGVSGGQCVNFARNYFLSKSFTSAQMPGLGSNGGAYMIYDNWDLGFSRGNVPANDSLLILDKSDSLSYGHVGVVTSSIKNTDGTYTLLVNESNWDLDEKIDCGINYTFNPSGMTVKRNNGKAYPIRGFVYSTPLITITPIVDIQSGNISINGSGYGTEQGKVTVTVYPLGDVDQSSEFNANLLPYSWSDTTIYANIYQGQLSSISVFNYPVTISVFRKDGAIYTKVAEATYPYKDVKPYEDFACAIQQLWKNTGNPISLSGKDNNGNFFPRELKSCVGSCLGFVTRAEFLTMAIKAKRIALVASPSTKFFSDVDLASWYAPYAYFAKSVGAVSGQYCGDPSLNCFFPDRQISREEAALILSKLYNLTYLSSTHTPYWNDYNSGKHIEPYMLFSYLGDNNCGTKGPVMGGNDGKFRPADRITREEAAGIISRGIKAEPWL